MHITYKGDYALKTMLDLAMHFGEEPISLKDLAKRADMPIKFLEQIMLELKHGGFVLSRRGKIGGYLLSKNPAEIKLIDVVRFIDGEIEPIACVRKEYLGCKDREACVFRPIWRNVTLAAEKAIGNITFKDLIKENEKFNRGLDYNI